jgi:hypothetical protein
MQAGKVWKGIAVLAIAGVVSASFAAPPIKASVILKEGDAFAGGTVTALNSPFTDANGKVGFLGTLDGSARFIYYDGAPAFISTDDPVNNPTGGEATIGISDTGDFIYSPSTNGGNDAVYTKGGLLLQETDPIPGVPGQFSRFNSRPRMTDGGFAYWIGGLTAIQGGSTQNYAVMTASDPGNPNSVQILYKGGDVLAGRTLDTGGQAFDMEFSGDGAHFIKDFTLNAPSASDSAIYVDGTWIATEGDPVGDGTNWANFDVVDINRAGNYMWTGNTDGDTNSNEYISYNGKIEIREGDTVDGQLLDPGYTVKWASLNEDGLIAHIWGEGFGSSLVEHLFVGPADDLINSTMLLSVGDEVDIDNDDIADWVITDFNASTHGLDLAEDGFVNVEVDVVPVAGGDEIEAVIRLAIPEPGTLSLLALGALALLRRR